MDAMQHIADLLLRRLQDSLDEEGNTELEAWLAVRPAHTRAFLAQASEWPVLEAALTTLYRVDEETARADVWARIGTSIPEKAPSAIRPLRRYWVAAAAAVLLVVTGLYWLTGRQDQHPVVAKVHYRKDLPPGGNKATLQLADGSVITLDSARNGQLAAQQHVLVVKDSTGIITYQPTVSATPAPLVFNTIRVPRGGQYQVVLPDGTHVWLNAASSLRYPTAFAGDERSVELTGEAYFEVAPDARRHFQVHVAGSRPTDVEVLGTSFNVNAYEDEHANVTTLVSGKVKVVAQSQYALLQPGLAAFTYAGGRPVQLRPADEAAALAWKEGLFYLQDADITDIMRQLSRWYDVDVVYDGTVKQHFVGRIPRNMNLSAVLKVLESTGWVHFSVEGRTVTVRP